MRSVILTGAAGGIGMAVLPKLVEHGYVVYAGAIDDWEWSEIERLKSQLGTDKIVPVMLDLREPAHIEAVVAQVEAHHPQLEGLLLNGAACPVPSPFEHLDLEITRDVYEIGVIGNLRLLQRSLKLLKATRGRIVYTSSMWGLIPAHLALSYSAHKHAAEACFAIIRREMKEFGIRVSVINPGGVKNTYMIAAHYYGARAVVAEIDGCNPADLGPSHYDAGKNTKLRQQRQSTDLHYRPVHFGYFKSLIALQDPAKMTFLATPAACADALMHALTSPRPKRRYLVGGDAKVLSRISRFLGPAVIDKIFASAFAPPRDAYTPPNRATDRR